MRLKSEKWPLDPELLEKIKINLFAEAHPAIEEWDRFPWHPSRAAGGTDAWQPNSSQALAIDVFGTLKLAPERHAILDRVAASMGCPTGGPWEVELEWVDPDNRLKEPRQTQVDAIARSPRTLLFFECKFTEADGGSCSQTNKKKSLEGRRQCDGHYREQVNPFNGVRSHCALSGKGVRYWESIPELFGLDPDGSYPCPFAGPWYQWMRNLALCREVARSEGLAPGFTVVYADAPALPFPKVLTGPEWHSLTAQLRPGTVPLTALSYQALLAQACECHGGIWADLESWVVRKVEQVSG